MADHVFCPPLVRTLKGAIHHPSCTYAKSGKPWVWADGRTLGEVGDAAKRNGLKECQRCFPLFRGLKDRA